MADTPNIPTMESNPLPGEVSVRGRPKREHRFNGVARIQGLLWELYDSGITRERKLLLRYGVHLYENDGTLVFPPSDFSVAPTAADDDAPEQVPPGWDGG